jgi:hypothetical protein
MKRLKLELKFEKAYLIEDFRNIIGYFKTLFVSIGVIFLILEQVLILRKLSEIILYLFGWISFINGSQKMNKDRHTNASFGFNACLNTVNLLPEAIISSSSEFIYKLCIAYYFD